MAIKSLKSNKLSQVGSHGVKLAPFEDGLNLNTFNNPGIKPGFFSFEDRKALARFREDNRSARFSLKDLFTRSGVPVSPSRTVLVSSSRYCTSSNVTLTACTSHTLT